MKTLNIRALESQDRAAVKRLYEAIAGRHDTGDILDMDYVSEHTYNALVTVTIGLLNGYMFLKQRNACAENAQ